MERDVSLPDPMEMPVKTMKFTIPQPLQDGHEVLHERLRQGAAAVA
ncbi:MAG: hypothetical protein IT518_19545 [Burkholderiales bacterium]|nr:hypothetical protein [Burkholderiales bacterium]